MIAAAVSTLLFYVRNRKALADAHATIDQTEIREIEALHHSALQRHSMAIGLAFFGAAVALLVTHHWIEVIRIRTGERGQDALAYPDDIDARRGQRK